MKPTDRLHRASSALIPTCVYFGYFVFVGLLCVRRLLICFAFYLFICLFVVPIIRNSLVFFVIFHIVHGLDVVAG